MVRFLPLLALFLLVPEALAQRGSWGPPRLVADLNTVDVGSHPAHLTAVGDKVFFTAKATNDSARLWVTDGTPGGERRIQDLPSRLEYPEVVARVGDRAVVSNRREEWLAATNGVPGSTEVLIETHGRLSIAGEFADRLFFTESVNGQGHLWVTDGTLANTVRLTPDELVGHAQGVVRYQDSYLFRTSEHAIWSTDGTRTGTQKVRTYDGNLSELHVLGDRLLVTDYPSLLTYHLRSGAQERMSDRVFSGTAQLDGLFLFAREFEGQVRLIRTDGTVAGTTEFSVLPDGGFSKWLGRVGDVVFFRYTSVEYQTELWRTDGTAAGTYALGDTGPYGSDMTTLASDDRHLYLSAGHRTLGWELWVSDGTPDGTEVIDLLAGPAGSNPCWAAPTSPGILLSATLHEVGQELLHFDPVTREAHVVADLASGESLGSNPFDFKQVGTELLFRATDNARSLLFQTDGSESGTHPVLDSQGSATRVSTTFVRADGTPFAIARGAGGSTLWRVAPRAEFLGSMPLWSPEVAMVGERIVMMDSRRAFSSGGRPGDIVQIGLGLRLSPWPWLQEGKSLAFFRASENGVGWYTTDGTNTGTRKIPGSDVQETYAKMVRGDTLWTIEQRAGKTGIWMLTPVSTEFVAEIPAVGHGGPLVALGRFLLFFDDSLGASDQIWLSDGTSGGTRLLSPDDGTDWRLRGQPVITEDAAYFLLWDSIWMIERGSGSMRKVLDADVSARLIGTLGGELLFKFDDGINGEELWSTDGRETRLLADINPGPGGSDARRALRVGDKLFVSASVPPYGQELWVMHYQSAPPLDDPLLPVPFHVEPPFPNPASEEIRATVRGHHGSITGQLHDALGRRLTSVKLTGRVGTDLNLTISTSRLAAGLYFLRISDGSTVRIQQVVVAR